VRILKEVMRRLIDDPLTASPAEVSQAAYDVAMELSGVADPYREEKARYNEFALGMYGELKERVRRAGDPLRTAAKLAVAGNVIDLGIGIAFDVRQEIERVVGGDFAVDHFERFRRELREAGTLLYLCDNAGEILFDRIFLEEIVAVRPALAVTAVVKSGPIINDATLEDAEAVGLAGRVRVIPCGAAVIGTPYRRVNEEVRGLLRSCDLVVGKGQGNFETTSGFPRPLYSILKAKCPCVADELGVEHGDVAFVRRTGAEGWEE
jgi:uncharacterized protein with ATP-grasp and redox domains